MLARVRGTKVRTPLTKGRDWHFGFYKLSKGNNIELQFAEYLLLLGHSLEHLALRQFT